MGSQREDESDGEQTGRDDKRRVEQSRIPAPPSGYARIDNLDDLDSVPSEARARRVDDELDDELDEEPVDEPVGAQEGEEQSNVRPASSQRRSHRWNRKPSITGQTPVVVDPVDKVKDADKVKDGGVDEAEEHPPLPVAALTEEPLPETVPTEAVRGVQSAAAADETVAMAAAADLLDVEAETVPVRTGEPYEEEAVAVRSRRITDLEDEVDELRRLSRRGTLDLGLLLLRVAVGAYLAVDGCRRMFGWWGGPSLNGFETRLLNTSNRAIGFDEQSAGVVAVGWSVTQIVVGIVLVFGFITPVIAAFGVAVTALDLVYGVTLAGEVNLFSDQKGSVAVPAALVVMLLAVILCGPGRYSLDGARRWALRPGIGSVAMILVGIAVAALVWMLFNGTNPLTSPGNPG